MTGDAPQVERVVAVERSIAAPPATVFAFFMSTEARLQWQGTEGEIDAQPGGVFRMNVRGDGFVSDHFIEVSLPTRLVFTWGWEGPHTHLRLTHRIRGVELEPLVQHGGSCLREGSRRSPRGALPDSSAPATAAPYRSLTSGYTLV